MIKVKKKNFFYLISFRLHTLFVMDNCVLLDKIHFKYVEIAGCLFLYRAQK